MNLDRFIGIIMNYVDFISKPLSTPRKPRTFQDPKTVGRTKIASPSQVNVGKQIFAAAANKRTRKGVSDAYDDNFHLSQGKSANEVMIYCTVLVRNILTMLNYPINKFKRIDLLIILKINSTTDSFLQTFN